MIVTPKELNNWSLNGKEFIVLDIRPKNQISKFPLLNLDHIKGDFQSIKNIEKRITFHHQDIDNFQQARI